MFEVLCMSENKEHTVIDFSSPICEALKGTEEVVEAGSIEPNIPISELSHCSKCGKLARPGVVWFDEIPRHLDQIDKLVDGADLCIVVGTSSTVRMAFSRNRTMKRLNVVF